MRFKPVPPAPAALDAVAAARDAVPLVPAPEADCCARVGDALDCERDVARQWLTFLRALGLVREAERGFVRTDATVERDALAAAFRERVHGASEVLAALDSASATAAADEPEAAGGSGAAGTTRGAVAERTADVLTRWERDRRPDAMAAWTERVGRLLGWATLLGLAERVEAGGETAGETDGRGRDGDAATEGPRYRRSSA
ncbi:MAG: hypothetical protein ABEJ42_09950 [Halobacteriaceae archaeon]